MNNLPWFKFNPDEWAFGSITSHDMCVQGLFINICGYYWKMRGDVLIEEVRKKYGRFQYFDELFGSCMYEQDGKLVIKFLDTQLADNQILSEVRAVSGSAGGKAKAAKAKQLLANANDFVANANDFVANAYQNVADRDREREEEEKKEKKKKKIFFENEFSGKKQKLDPKISKDLKKLEKLKKINLGEIEQRFFQGKGTEFVIEEFQKDFADQGKKHFSESATETSFNAWAARLKLRAVNADLEEKLPISVKVTPELESKIAEFRILEGVHSTIRSFMANSPTEKRSSLISLLIESHGLEETVRKIFTYWARKNFQDENSNTVEDFRALEGKIKMSDQEWNDLVKNREIIFP